MSSADQISWQPYSHVQSAPELRPTSHDTSTNTTPYYQWNRVPVSVAILIMLPLLIAAPFAYGYLARLDVNSDPYTYAEDGKEILAGKRLYSEIPADKGPLLALGFAIPQIFSPRNFQAVGMFLGFVLIGQALIFAWMFRFNPPAMVAAALFTILVPMTSQNFYWLSSEHLSNLFVVANLAVAYRIARLGRFTLLDCFLVGAISCLALNVRQTALFSGIVPAVLWFVYAKSGKQIIQAIAFGFLGGMAIFLIVLGLVARIGDVHGYLTMLFVHSAAYGGEGSWDNAWRLFTRNSSQPLAIFAILFLAIALVHRHRAIVISAVIAGVLTVAIPRRDYAHYLVGLFPYVALLIGIGLERCRRFDQIIGWASGALLIYLCHPLVMEDFTGAKFLPTELGMAHVAAAIDRNAPPSATLLVWGPMGSEAIVFSSRLPTASKYWILWMLDQYVSGSTRLSANEVIYDYLSHPPTIIAMDRGFLQDIRTDSEVPELHDVLRLGKALLLKYKYVVRDSVNGFDIAVLRDGPGGIPGAGTQTSQDGPL